MKCRYGLYEECIYHKVTGKEPSKDDCKLCMKAYRLKNGLVTVIKARGTRFGVTL